MHKVVFSVVCIKRSGGAKALYSSILQAVLKLDYWSKGSCYKRGLHGGVKFYIFSDGLFYSLCVKYRYYYFTINNY